MPKSLVGQIAAYVVGGGAMTLLHSLSYWTMAQLGGIDPYVANTLAALIAGVAGYVLHSRWTFGHTNDSGGGARATLRYIVVSLLCYALNSLWVWLIVRRLGQTVAISIIPMVLVTPWLGFILNRYWTFSR